MDSIQYLITKNDWILQCWDDRYGRGIWALVAPHVNHTYEMQQITDGGDIESMKLGEYFHEAGSWLPVANGHDLAQVLTKLNEKAELLTNNDALKAKVYDAFQRLIEVNDGNYGLFNAVSNGDENLLKPIKP